MGMSMAQAARELGISVSLIRHYEREFELRFERTKGGQRVLTDRDVENLRIIRSYRERNLPIEDIRQQLLSPPEVVPPSGPVLEDVIAAMIARQDELERVVKAQQELIQGLMAENQRILESHEGVRLLLEAPKEPDPGLLALADQVAAIQSRQEDQLGSLQVRLEELQAAVAATPADSLAEMEALQNRLAELESELRLPADSDPAVAALQVKLSDIEKSLEAKRGLTDEGYRSLQRRLLDLEAALATREESQGTGEEEGLLETLAKAISQEAARRKPWWQFWG